jgi:hypothetical protein
MSHFAHYFQNGPFTFAEQLPICAWRSRRAGGASTLGPAVIVDCLQSDPVFAEAQPAGIAGIYHLRPPLGQLHPRRTSRATRFASFMIAVHRRPHTPRRRDVMSSESTLSSGRPVRIPMR